MEQECSFSFALDGGCVEYELHDEEQRLEGMCRVCASTETSLMSIFDCDGQSKGIVDLINNHLPILVTPTDLLPISICTSCFEILSSIHSLVDICVKANERMQQMLQDATIGFSELNNCDVNIDECEPLYLQIEPSEKRADGEVDHKHILLDPSAENQEEISAGTEPDHQGELSHKEKKLYRCLHCDKTDTNAYLLLLHQIKSHPGKLLKCNYCEFVYSADQRSKYNEHLKLHTSDPPIKFESSSVAVGNEDLVTNCLQQKTSEEFEETEIVESTKLGAKASTKKKSKSERKRSLKKEVHWRCGFCGMKAKSKPGLIDHCHLRHKERLGLSFLESDGLECMRCKQTFESEVWLKDHLCHSVFLPKSIPPPKELACLTCPEVFSDVKQFRGHLLSHTNSVKCDICGAHFRSQSHLQSHIVKHKKPCNQCPHCPRSFKLKSRLNIHLRSHTGERPFMCVKCGKQFSTDSGFRLHMAAHEGKKPYICSLCGQTFNRPSNLRRHESVCGGKKFECRVCKDQFDSRQEMHCHFAMHSKEEREAQLTQQAKQLDSKADRFSCKVCGLKFDRVIELSQHKQDSHSASEIEEAKKAGQVDGGAFVCPDCGKQVYNLKNFERHMLIHGGNAQFPCRECSNVYSSKFALDYHMYTHTGERPFQCDLCPQGFKTRISLKIHRMKHTGEKPYKCRTCSMSFITAASLRLHLVTHSDTRMFPCSYCPASFKRKKTLVTHIRIHTGEKPYACKFCPRRFTQKGACSQHEKTHSEPKKLRVMDDDPNEMQVVVKNWEDDVIESFPEDDSNRIDVLVSQEEGNASSQSEEVQHMVRIQQDVDCVIGEPDLMEISGDLVLQSNKHTIIIEQDGILGDAPIAGLKDANSDPQMPVPDE